MPRDLGTSVIYVIGVTDNPVKIGHADTMEGRLKQLQTGNPDKLVCHHAEPVSWASAPFVERAIHAELRAHHRRGEWFNVHKDVAIEAVKRIKADWLLKYQHRQARDTFWVRLETKYGLDTGAPRALETYRAEKRAHPAGAYVTSANAYIQRVAGGEACSAFSVAISQVAEVLTPERAEAIDAALARALNALAQFDSEYRLKLSQRSWDERTLKRWAKHATQQH